MTQIQLSTKIRRNQYSNSDIDSLASLLQQECLSIRKELFWHDTLGFNYNWAYCKPSKNHNMAEKRINEITGNRIRFLFISHRELFMLTDISNVHLKAPNKYGCIMDENMMDSPKNNPYSQIDRAIKELMKK